MKAGRTTRFGGTKDRCLTPAWAGREEKEMRKRWEQITDGDMNILLVVIILEAIGLGLIISVLLFCLIA